MILYNKDVCASEVGNCKDKAAYREDELLYIQLRLLSSILVLLLSSTSLDSQGNK